MSSAEGSGGGSDDQPQESVEYSGVKTDGVMYLVFGVISIVVIVVVVLLVVFLMNRHTTTAEPAMESTSAGSKCTNPCMGAGKVCHPDSRKDANGCFVQDCHCYSPNAAHTCSNPCNATGQVCHFNSPMDEHGCYLPSCRCITCKRECPLDRKCDPNTPWGPDGCPMSGCTCVPSMCPARCPSGRQCAPDAPTDANGCFDMDCMCVPVSLATTPLWTTPSVETPKPCPTICPADQSCHKLTPVDASGCFVPPCTCIRNSCTNPCPPDQICELKTPLDDNGCPMSGCTCVHEKGYVPPVVTKHNNPTAESTQTTDRTDTDINYHTTATTDPFEEGRALEDDAGHGGSNATDSKGSETTGYPDDNATVPHSSAGPDSPPDTLSTGNHSGVDTVPQSSTARDELSTSSASGDNVTDSANNTDKNESSQEEKFTGSEETSVKTELSHVTESNGGEGSSDASTHKLISTEGGTVSEGDKSTQSIEDTSVAGGDTASESATSTGTSEKLSTAPEKSEKGETSPPDVSEGTTKSAGEERANTEDTSTGKDTLSAEGAVTASDKASGEPAGAAELSTVAPAGSSRGEESGPRVRRSINAAAFPVIEPPVISLSRALVKEASAALNATRVLAQAHRGGIPFPDDTRAKYAPILIPSGDAPPSVELHAHTGKEGTFEKNITRLHQV
ncbi:uncharacterized protein LOC142803426 isoform X1 [Rhipicephalus microplus]|uniref:uncharacterized protein LOC142803426 isoform X1 n=1 Tax=Rhipicephalus microplus TaxID=6941 RepID=UPI003F6CFA51